jgi:hypothetical protein
VFLITLPAAPGILRLCDNINFSHKIRTIGIELVCLTNLLFPRTPAPYAPAILDLHALLRLTGLKEIVFIGGEQDPNNVADNRNMIYNQRRRRWIGEVKWINDYGKAPPLSITEEILPALNKLLEDPALERLRAVKLTFIQC